MKNHVGFGYDENAIGNQLELSYNQFLNLDDETFQDESIYEKTEEWYQMVLPEGWVHMQVFPWKNLYLWFGRGAW